MYRYIDLRLVENRSGELGTTGWMAILWGLLLIGSGVLIVFWPELLALLVASLLISGGVLSLALAGHIWMARKRYQRFLRRLVS